MKLLNVIVDFYMERNFISEEKKEFFALGYPSISGSYQPPQPAGLKEYAEKCKKKADE